MYLSSVFIVRLRESVAVYRQSTVQKGFRRRSEVDRRLDHLVGTSGKLRETGLNSIIKMLRLFNLCDLTTSSSSASPTIKVVVHSCVLVSVIRWLYQ